MKRYVITYDDGDKRSGEFPNYAYALEYAESNSGGKRYDIKECADEAESFQMTLDGFTSCDVCLYGRNLGGNDWGCRSERRRQASEKLVHNLTHDKYSCPYAEHK